MPTPVSSYSGPASPLRAASRCADQSYRRDKGVHALGGQGDRDLSYFTLRDNPLAQRVGQRQDRKPAKARSRS